MAYSTLDEAKYEVCFVQTGDSSTEATEVLKLAFEAMYLNQLDPKWVSVEDCLKISKHEPKHFVLDPFEGAVFEHLKNLQCRILGPLYILYCLQYGDVLEYQYNPVYSSSMYKITVSCSNIQTRLRDEIRTKVQLMGGFFSKDLNENVTHLVVGEVGSQKYKVAAHFGLPIMVPEWITDVWENGQHQQLHASDRCYDKYKCPIFKGLVITVSQLSEEERLTIKKVIEYNGGSYSGSLKSTETTHLILNEPTGDKYRFAKSWKVICVNAKWVLESLESGYCCDEELYGIDETSQTQLKRSTRINDLTSCELPLADCSGIVGQPGVSHLDETMKKEFSFNITNKRNSYIPLDEFNLSTLPKSGEFLDGCKIFLTGFNPSHMVKLRKIVISGSGIRFPKYSDSISHVVCGKLSDDLLKIIKSGITKPFVVNYEWLLDCCKNDKLLDEKPYLCVDMNTLSPKEEQEDFPKIDISSHMPQNSSQVKNEDFLDEEMIDIFKQYISGPQLEDDKENKGCKLENQKNSFKSKPLHVDGAKESLSIRGVKHNDFPQTDIPLQHTRINKLCNGSRRESINRSSLYRPTAESSLRASASLKGKFKFQWKLNGILNDLHNSRESFGNIKKHSSSLREMFSQNLSVASSRVDAKSSFGKDDSKVLGGNDNKSDKPDVLSGVVLYVSRKLCNIDTELSKIVVQLGGSYIWSYGDNCTHFVFVGKANDINKEFREARKKGKKIVSPEWVYACKEKKSHVEEDLYPHTYKAALVVKQAEDSRIDEIVEVLDVPNKVPAKKKTFMFTNIPDSLKADCIVVVKKLGGEIVYKKIFDINATHLIVLNPVMNEIFLSSVASGKWVLHPLYLSESLELGKFANEAEYEWGGTSTEKFIKNLRARSSKIAECPHRWRCKIQHEHVSGAFYSWKVVIHTDDMVKRSTYMKILQAGGAEIIQPEVVNSSLDKITHVFVEIKKITVTKIDLSLYMSNNIKCVKIEYLAFYLIEDSPPDIESFLVSESHLSFSMSLSKKRNSSPASCQSKSKKLRLK